jgi:hypothetical protein
MASPVLRLSGWTVIGSDGKVAIKAAGKLFAGRPKHRSTYTVSTTIRLAFLSSSIASAVVAPVRCWNQDVLAHALSRGPRRRDHRLAGLTGIWTSVPDESPGRPPMLPARMGKSDKTIEAEQAS